MLLCRTPVKGSKTALQDANQSWRLPGVLSEHGARTAFFGADDAAFCTINLIFQVLISLSCNGMPNKSSFFLNGESMLGHHKGLHQRHPDRSSY